MFKHDAFQFEYALQRRDGKLYNGRTPSLDGDKVTTLDMCFTDEPQSVYSFTEYGAHETIRRFPCFADCKVVRR